MTSSSTKTLSLSGCLAGRGAYVCVRNCVTVDENGSTNATVTACFDLAFGQKLGKQSCLLTEQQYCLHHMGQPVCILYTWSGGKRRWVMNGPPILQRYTTLSSWLNLLGNITKTGCNFWSMCLHDVYCYWPC